MLDPGKTAKLANWYWRLRVQTGIAGNAESDWRWAEKELASGFRLEWQAHTTYGEGERLVDDGGHIQFVTRPGTSGAVKPVWNRNGGMTTDPAEAIPVAATLQERNAPAAAVEIAVEWQDMGPFAALPPGE